jgi:hypothetical protein
MIQQNLSPAEEIQSRGPLPVWHRDGDNAHTLRITRRGRQAIRVDEETAAADELAKKPAARSAKIAPVRSGIRPPHNARRFQAS